MERRDFIQKTILTSSSLALVPSLFANQIHHQVSTKAKLTILHTNDTHSNIDAFPLNHAKHPGLGGVSKRYELIQEIRATNEHVLLLDAGDIFQGTPYFNRFGGELEMKVMSKLAYDVATMGNHDFDGGKNTQIFLLFVQITILKIHHLKVKL
jgi:5'-nucleotidase